MLEYRELGISVIRVPFMQKAAGPWMEFQNRIATIEEIEEWCRVRCNVALVMGQVSGLVGVDADSDAALAWIKKNLPESPVGTRTPKGEHSFYSLPDGMTVGNRARLKGMKLDVRGEGGYLLASPSVHPSGGQYEKIGDWSKIRECPVFDPNWLEFDRIKKPDHIADDRKKVGRDHVGGSNEMIVTSGWSHPDVQRRAHAYAKKVPGAVSGNGGHRATFVLALKLARLFALNEDELFEVMWGWNDSCDPKWTRKEIQHKCIEAVAYANREVSATTKETRNDMTATLKNMRVDTCNFCNEKKLGFDFEANGKTVFYCEGHAKTSMKAHSGLKTERKKPTDKKS